MKAKFSPLFSKEFAIGIACDKSFLQFNKDPSNTKINKIQTFA